MELLKPGKYELDRKSVIVTCPKCGNKIVLDGGYDIEWDGMISPAVKCGCGYNGYIMLIGWKDKQTVSLK